MEVCVKTFYCAPLHIQFKIMLQFSLDFLFIVSVFMLNSGMTGGTQRDQVVTIESFRPIILQWDDVMYLIGENDLSGCHVQPDVNADLFLDLLAECHPLPRVVELSRLLITLVSIVGGSIWYLAGTPCPCPYTGPTPWAPYPDHSDLSDAVASSVHDQSGSSGVSSSGSGSIVPSTTSIK